jgi:hypothetical protein
MALQRSVQQQNALTKTHVHHSAALFAEKDGLPWLRELLRERGSDPDRGILAKLEHVPEQEGDFYAGIWLSSAHTFWAFSATISRSSGVVISIESFDNITHQVVVEKNLPGTGRSFGQLAIEVLRERSDA